MKLLPQWRFLVPDETITEMFENLRVHENLKHVWIAEIPWIYAQMLNVREIFDCFGNLARSIRVFILNIDDWLYSHISVLFYLLIVSEISKVVYLRFRVFTFRNILVFLSSYSNNQAICIMQTHFILFKNITMIFTCYFYREKIYSGVLLTVEKSTRRCAEIVITSVVKACSLERNGQQLGFMDENITEFVPRQLWVLRHEHKYWLLRNTNYLRCLWKQCANETRSYTSYEEEIIFFLPRAYYAT